MEPFAETIRDADVTSIAGLRAKTLVAIWDYQPLSSRHEGNFELDNDDSHWSLFSGAVSVTGLSDDDVVTRSHENLRCTVCGTSRCKPGFGGHR